MSKPIDINQDGDESAILENTIVDGDNTEEESDEFEEIDDEEERQLEGEEEEEGEKGQNTLTHLLLGNTNGAAVENEVDFHEEDEEDLDEGEDEDDEYVEDDEDEDEYVVPSTTSNKRSIDEVADKEVSQGLKKIKA